jgi:predicted nuclease of restriction endonuclease-like (RecB) superfamily
LPAGYASFLDDVKTRIRTAQVRAALAVNAELVLLYWSIGRDILARQKKEGWGAHVIDRLSDDLHTAFPEMKGFSPRNLKYMRAFAEAGPANCAAACCTIALVSQLPLLDRVKDPRVREWYALQAIEHGWSRNVLVAQIETGLHKRAGKGEQEKQCRGASSPPLLEVGRWQATAASGAPSARPGAVSPLLRAVCGRWRVVF